MINYADQTLFLQDSIDKQLSVTFSGGSIGNSQINAEEFSLEEILNSGSELTFGECNAAKVEFTVGFYNKSISGKELTIKTTPDGAASPFQFGKYTVLSDFPTADRRWRKVVAFDKLYNILKTDVAGWYNSILPDENTSMTLRQFRDSFFSHFNLTQDSATLPNDSMTVKRTVDPKVMTGKTVLNKIIEINGGFGKIGRNGNFQYKFLEIPAAGLFPSNTLYPSNSLYPRRYGMAREQFTGGKYIGLKYEEYLTETISKVEILNAEGSVAASAGTGSNVYIVKDNFLLFGKETAELETIAGNMLNQINGIWYRPAQIQAVGNPCTETGDGLKLFTIEGKQIDTYVLKRKLKGIQSLKDTIIADGLEKRANDKNTTSEQIIQNRQNINQVKADLIEAERIIAGEIQADRARIGDLEADHVSVADLQATNARIGDLEAIAITTQNLSAQTISAGQISTGIMSAQRIADANGLAQYTGWYESDFVWEVYSSGTVTVYGPDPDHPGQMTTFNVSTGVASSKHHMAVLKGSAVT